MGFLVPLLVVAAALLATIDDRHVGRAADERQMIWTAVALTETGQWTQARDRDFNYVTADGRAVSRFGMGMTLLQLPAAWLAPVVERATGRPGASQPLFLVAPLLLVLASAWASAVACRRLGGGPAPAILLVGLGSPLGAYASSGLSESLQAAALGGAFAASLVSARTSQPGRASRAALLAGVLAGIAVLAKSALIAVAPLAVIPLAVGGPESGRARRILWAAMGLVPVLIAWSAIEWARFGSLFGSYPGESFNHPPLDGFWRLLVGPNLGIVYFFPAILIAGWAFITQMERREWVEVGLMAGAVLPFSVLLILAASWWAWHGVWGWGPRLLVPALPALGAVAAAAMARWPRRVQGAIIAVSVAINVPGLLQHSTPVAAYVSNLSWPKVPEAFARSMAGYATRIEDDGTFRVSPDHVLATVPAASQFIVFPWFFYAFSFDDASETAKVLATPPWVGVRPDLVPAETPIDESFLRYLTGPPRARFWGRGFMPSLDDARHASVFDEGLADQVVRLQQLGSGAEALALAGRLVELSPFGEHDALVLESFRLLGQRQLAADYLSRLPVERRVCPTVNVVLALFERDAGHEESAKQLLGSVAAGFPADAPLHAALSSPLTSWPAGLQSMIAKPVKTAGP